MSEQAEKKSYKKTLNLPKTSFSMKANLVQREPEFQKRWEKINLYQKIRDNAQGKPKFILHDGPPYANGAIHLGHLLNKVLKDLVVRTRTLSGYDVPFVPGWDCHGLPIEHKVMKELGAKAKDMSALDIRRQCQKDASKFVKLQTKQMKRLGTIADYDDPYLTMNPVFEKSVLEVFADLVEKDLVYRALKPVHWSIANQTALADAELEYMDKEDTSIYVLFEIENPQDLPGDLMARPGLPISLMIWTTTPWTLPANLAVAVSPQAEYGLFRYQLEDREGLVLIAADMAEKVFSQVENTIYEMLGVCTGQEIVDAGVKYRHPFIEDQVSPVVTADYVTLEDGCGLVHTAPGHGQEDYQTGLRCGLDIYCPVQADGTFDDTAPDWLTGKSIWDGNDLVIENLKESGNLFHANQFMHSYPHDWRSKTPVIFRATEQWFIGVDRPISLDSDSVSSLSLRKLAKCTLGQFMQAAGGRAEAWKADKKLLESLTGIKLPDDKNNALKYLYENNIEPVRFIPNWGHARMQGMLDSRPDWCLSRQRAWGLPIPAFYDKDGNVLLTPASVRAVASVIEQHGSDAWFKAPAADLLVNYNPADDPAAPEWIKGKDIPTLELTKSVDIFDVWFESGSSWHAVARRRNLGYPVDMYLEGSDQHRGWFQLSLLPALGVTGQAPFKTVLTHGFMVDKDGRKMSKSGGNALNVDDLFKDFGADICRWWVAGLNTDNDVKVDFEFFRLAGEEYRKVRNTLRFLLSNLDDFDNSTNRRELTAEDATSIDAWIISELNNLVQTVTDAYNNFAFRKAREAIFHFCNETLSSEYLVATKDRLYCDAVDAPRRRRSQTAIYDTAKTLIQLMAPILVHTADEAWLSLLGLDNKSEDSVHLHEFPKPTDTPTDERWNAIMTLRHEVLKAIEQAKSQHGIENPLDAGVTVNTIQDLDDFLPELADLCGVSRFTLNRADEQSITVQNLSDEPRCERSWKRDGTVKERSDGGLLSDRDADVLGVD